MDAHIWNTYHIISNRARSVCYTIRQSQFKIQTELAVNKLSQSTIYQLKTMEELSINQDEVLLLLLLLLYINYRKSGFFSV